MAKKGIKGKGGRNRRGPTPKRKAPKTDPAVTAKLPRPEVSEYMRYTAVPIFPDRPESPPSGSHGRYVVTFVLGIPGMNTVTEDLHIPLIMESGDSLLAVPKNVHRYSIAIGGTAGTLDNTFEARKNSKGRLARIGTSIEADSFAQAEEAASDLLMPQLSLMAVEADVPLEVKATIILEESSRTQFIGTTMMGKAQPMPMLHGMSNPDLRPLLASYREGLNSTSPNYQCLCFWKVLEGVSTFHTNIVRAMAKVGATPPPDPTAKAMPENEADLPNQLPWAVEIMRPFLGRTYKQVMDETRDTIRNAVAHITPGKELLLADYFADMERCRKILPVLRFIARDLIQCELALLAAECR